MFLEKIVMHQQANQPCACMTILLKVKVLHSKNITTSSEAIKYSTLENPLVHNYIHHVFQD